MTEKEKSVVVLDKDNKNLAAYPKIHIVDVDLNFGEGSSSNEQIEKVKIVQASDNEFYFDASWLVRAIGEKNGAPQKLRRLSSKYKVLINKEENPGYFTEEELANNSLKEKNFITRSGAFSLLLTLRTYKARLFHDWVCDIVLPCIQDYGNYKLGMRPKTSLELPAEKPEEVPASSKKLKAAVEEFKLLKSFGEEMLGYDHNLALLRANDAVDKEYDINMLWKMQHRCISEVQETMMSVTDLFVPFSISAKKGNEILIDMKLQWRERDKKDRRWIYHLTEKGRGYGRVLDVLKVDRTDGSATNQIVWYEKRTRDAIQAFLEESKDPGNLTI